MNFLKIEGLLGIITLGTAAVASTGVTLPEGSGEWKQFIELGALAIVLIVVLSYLFRVFLPKWMESNDQRFKDQQETFDKAIGVFNTAVTELRDEVRRSQEAAERVNESLRGDFRTTLDTIANRFDETLDKVAQENREIWKMERERFQDNYTDLSKSMEKLCSAVCEAIEDRKDRTKSKSGG
jgi:uncharacterized protein YukE